MLASASVITKAEDDAMDRSASKGKAAPAGLSIRNGPVDDDEMDVDHAPNGTAKRKSRASIDKVVSYKDDSDDSDGAPLVCTRRSI